MEKRKSVLLGQLEVIAQFVHYMACLWLRKRRSEAIGRLDLVSLFQILRESISRNKRTGLVLSKCPLLESRQSAEINSRTYVQRTPLDDQG